MRRALAERVIKEHVRRKFTVLQKNPVRELVGDGNLRIKGVDAVGINKSLGSEG